MTFMHFISCILIYFMVNFPLHHVPCESMSHKIELSVTKCYVKMCPCPFFISLPLEKGGPFYCTILLLSALQHYRVSCSKVLGKKGKWVSEESRVLNDPSNRFYDVLWCLGKKNSERWSFLNRWYFWNWFLAEHQVNHKTQLVWFKVVDLKVS